MTAEIPRTAAEASFDALTGPSYHFSELQLDGRTPTPDAERIANPLAAARQGLAKMRTLASLGVLQGVLPPQDRLHVPTLRALGFDGRDADVLYRVRRDAPQLLAAMASAAVTPISHAATLSPGVDCAEGRLQLTPANLDGLAHRGAEPWMTARALAMVFRSESHFRHHGALANGRQQRDQGSVNQLRLSADFASQGLALFIHDGPLPPPPKRGAAMIDVPEPAPDPARQHHAASLALAKGHRLDPDHVLHLRLHPDALAAGVMRAAEVALAHRELLIHHQHAFVDGPSIRAWATRRLQGREPVCIEIADRDLSLAEARSSGLFESQIVSLADGSMRLICSATCRDQGRAWAVVRRLFDDSRNLISEAVVVELGEVLHRGGGPASLRLAVVLDAAQQAAVNPKVWLDEALAVQLDQWLGRWYRDRLRLDDLADPQLLDASRSALDALTQILGLGSIYDFQR